MISQWIFFFFFTHDRIYDILYDILYLFRTCFVIISTQSIGIDYNNSKDKLIFVIQIYCTQTSKYTEIQTDVESLLRHSYIFAPTVLTRINIG